MTPAEFRALRESIPLTQEQLGKRLDLHRVQIARIEAATNGKDTIKPLHEYALRWVAQTERA